MKRSIYSWVLEILALLCLIWSFYPFCFYDKFRGPIPIHFNIAGQIDGWGNRSFFWFLPAWSLFFYIGMSILEKYCPKLNYPVKVTEKNADSLYKLAAGLLRHMKFIIILQFAYLNNTIMSIALSKGSGLNIYIIIALIAGLMIIVFSYIIRMMRVKG